MRLTKTTSHAIRILIECAGADGRLINTASIARRLDMSPLHVLKIVHILSVAGFVECTRGRNGGVGLSRSPDAIRIGDVVRTMEFSKLEKAGAARSSDKSKIALESIFDDALDAFIGVLDQHTLADMAGACLGTGERPRPGSSPLAEFAKSTLGDE